MDVCIVPVMRLAIRQAIRSYIAECCSLFNPSESVMMSVNAILSYPRFSFLMALPKQLIAIRSTINMHASIALENALQFGGVTITLNIYIYIYLYLYIYIPSQF